MNPLIKALEMHGCSPRLSAGNWMAKCPAHEDKVKSLSVRESEDITLLFCHAHCQPIEVLEALDLPWSAMFGDADDHLIRPVPPKGEEAPKPIRRPTPVASTIVMPIRTGVPVPNSVLLYKGQKPSKTWWYRNAEGQPLFATCRWDIDGEKKRIRHITMHREGNALCWKLGDLPSPRPLYGLDRLALMPDQAVLLVEGEKTAEAAHGRIESGAVAVTWCGGAAALNKVDWSPLDGKEVICWPDADRAGIECMQDLCEQHKGWRLVEPLPWVEEGWDLADPTPPHVNVSELFNKAWTPSSWDIDYVMKSCVVFRPWDDRYKGPFQSGGLRVEMGAGE